LIHAKVVQVRKQGYIHPGKLIKGIHYFCVDKGLKDIWMVYKKMSSHSNNALWAPRLDLPTVTQTLWALLLGYHHCNLDVGELFSNHLLHMDLRE
jgi:hypothetical protein